MTLVKKIYAIAIFFLIVGGMAWGYIGMKGKNPVSQALGKYAWIVYGLVGLSAIVVLAAGRIAFLPFLGPTVFPCAALQNKVPENANTDVEVHVRPGSKILYWGAEPNAESLKALKSWKEAYGHFDNVGVATADESGKVVLRLRKPQPYKVPLKGRLESHLHYRICLEDGWMSQVETHILFSEPFIDFPNIEAFQNPPDSAPTSSPQPVPEAPVIPVVASTPELPVIADPVSGLPTAVPADVVPAVVSANASTSPSPSASTSTSASAPSTVEGFSNEPLFSSSTAAGAPLGNVEAEDPRLLRLRSSVEVDSLKVEDSMGFMKNMGFSGTDLNTAFQPSLRPTGAPTRAWGANL